MLGAVAMEVSVTDESAVDPSLLRLTARVIESPGTKLLVVTGMATPPLGTFRLMSSVPVCTVVATGVVLSVKVPKVPRPATAAAAPAMASEPMTLRLVLRRVLVLMVRSPCVRCVVGFPATGRTLEGQPQGTRPVTARIPQGLSEEAPERRKPRFPGVLEGLEGVFGHLTARGQVPETAGDQ